MDEQLRQNALAYHERPKPGKISVTPTKPLSNQLDLSLAYSPGVAAACEAIHANPLDAQKYTSRSNLVGVVTNGTAVLGLGNHRPARGQAGDGRQGVPLQEVRGYRRVRHRTRGIGPRQARRGDRDARADARRHQPRRHQGANQHGTAIIASAAILNGLKVVGKDLSRVKLVCSGAGAAAIACLDLLVKLGLSKDNVLVTDSKGVNLRRPWQPRSVEGALRREHRRAYAR